MKYVVIIALSCLLAACEMTAEDWRSASAFVGESVKAYGEIERQSRLVGYDAFGYPIYR